MGTKDCSREYQTPEARISSVGVRQLEVDLVTMQKDIATQCDCSTRSWTRELSRTDILSLYRERGRSPSIADLERSSPIHSFVK